MAAITSGGLHKAQEVVKKTASKNKKMVDLEPSTANVHTKQSITTDHGTRVSNADNWLKSVDGKRAGPSLLEDQISREKVCVDIVVLVLHPDFDRFTVLTTSVSPREWCMRVAPVRLGTLSSRRAQRISHTLGS